MSKPPQRRGRVLFINAINEVTRQRSLSYLTPEHQERIADAYHTFGDIPDFANAATLDEIRANAGNLSIPLYVRRRGRGVRDPAGEYAADGLPAAIAAWEQSSQQLNAAIAELLEMIEKI